LRKDAEILGHVDLFIRLTSSSSPKLIILTRVTL
jgi:hypothetical protein